MYRATNPADPMFTAAALLSAAKGGALSTMVAEDLTDINAALLDETGQYSKVVSAEVMASFSHNTRRQFCVKTGCYQLITTELVEYLSALKKGVTIEVGAGNGLIASSLNIPATDNRMQENPDVIAHYTRAGQSVITYGDNVEKLDANDAKDKYNPNVILSAWITGKKGLGGKPLNMYGPNLKTLAKGVDFVLVGNLFTHKDCILFAKDYWEVSAPWIFSRAERHHLNRIFVWGSKPPEILGAKVYRVKGKKNG